MLGKSATALLCLLTASAALAQDRKPFTAAEMQALLAKGLLVNSSDLDGGKVFTVVSPRCVGIDVHSATKGTQTRDVGSSSEDGLSCI